MNHLVKGQIKPKAVWWARCRFSQKTKKAEQQTKQICLLVFWENLRRANLLSVLSDLYPPNICWEITNTIQQWRLGIFDQITKRCNFMHEIFRMFFRQVYNLFPIRCAAGQEIRDHMCPFEGRKKKIITIWLFLRHFGL